MHDRRDHGDDTVAARLLAGLARGNRLPWRSAQEQLGGRQALDDVLAGWQELALPVRRQDDALVWSSAIAPLSAADIADRLTAQGEPCEVTVEILADSTNAQLLSASAAGAGAPRALLAECQREGRGRRQRVWRARYGEAILLSLLLDCPRPPAELPGVAIVAGLALARSFAGLGVPALAVKWPNDVLLQQAKLAGILVESAGRGGQIVIGVGINWRGAERLSAVLERPVAALATALPEATDRSAIAAAVIAALMADVRRFAEQGLRPFLEEFARYDALAGRLIRVSTADSMSRFGIARGLAGDGGLKVDHGGAVAIYHSAEVSVVLA